MPKLNLIVLRANNIEKTKMFYEHLGFSFILEKHENGPEHYACELNGLVLEIYPLNNLPKEVNNIMLGFSIDSLEYILNNSKNENYTIIKKIEETERGKRIIILDPDGRKIELIEQTIDNN